MMILTESANWRPALTVQSDSQPVQVQQPGFCLSADTETGGAIAHMSLVYILYGHTHISSAQDLMSSLVQAVILVQR